jgi:hypothetical protein
MIVLRNIIVGTAMLSFGISVAGASAVHLDRDAERVDPISGLHWQRVLDPKHPAAPPRLTRQRGSAAELSRHGESSRPALCVRAGDHVSLRSANAGLSMSSLEATALQNGVCGARVRARVTVTGALVEMTVLDSGAAILSGKVSSWQ